MKRVREDVSEDESFATSDEACDVASSGEPCDSCDSHIDVDDSHRDSGIKVDANTNTELNTNDTKWNMNTDRKVNTHIDAKLNGNTLLNTSANSPLSPCEWQYPDDALYVKLFVLCPYAVLENALGPRHAFGDRNRTSFEPLPTRSRIQRVDVRLHRPEDAQTLALSTARPWKRQALAPPRYSSRAHGRNDRRQATTHAVESAF